MPNSFRNSLFLPVLLHEKLDDAVGRVRVGEFFKRVSQVALDRTTTGVGVGGHEVDLFTGFFSGRMVRVRVGARRGYNL